MPLTSLRLLVLLGVLFLVLLGLAIRGRRLVTMTCGVLAVVMLLGAVAAGVNRHFDLFRSWASLAGTSSRDLVHAGSPAALSKETSTRAPGVHPSTRGTLLSLTIPATTSHLAVDGGFVYLPAAYRDADQATTGFPVVEAFSGSPGQPANWINGVLADTQLDRAIAGHLIAPEIVVFPPTNQSVLRSLECTNTADGLRDEDYLTTDVHNWVTQTFRTNGQRWTAMGYSTGGYCALDLAFRHPDLFAKAISLDGYGQALKDNYARGLWHSKQDRLDHSPNWWVLHHAPEPVDVYLSAGTDDREAVHDARTTWEDMRLGKWLSPADSLVYQARGHHTFDAWERAFIPSLQWALPAGTSSAT